MKDWQARAAAKRRLFWRRISLVQRLLPRVEVRGPQECWPCRGARRNGYGAMTVHRRARYAHRVMWEIAHGPIPRGLFVLHRCDNPPCVNPAHLFLGTVTDNHKDMVLKGRHSRGDRHGARLHPECFPRGERQHFAKLSDAAVTEIRRLLARGLPQSEIAARFGVAQSQISAVKTGRSWRHVA